MGSGRAVSRLIHGLDDLNQELRLWTKLSPNLQREELPHVAHEFVIFAGTANPELAVAIAAELGVVPGACTIDRFPDGEP